MTECVATAGTTNIVIDKASTDKLLSIARKQLESEGRLGITKAEFQDELEHLYKYADDVQYNNGFEKGKECGKLYALGEIESCLGEFYSPDDYSKVKRKIKN